MSAAAKRKYNTIQLNNKLATISTENGQRNLKKKKKRKYHLFNSVVMASLTWHISRHFGDDWSEILAIFAVILFLPCE
jgi:hypothetical protein